MKLLPLLVLLALALLTGCTGTPPGVSENVADLYSGNVSVQREAAMRLVETGSPAVPCLINVFSSGDENASRWAGTALCEIGKPSVAPLIESLETKDDDARMWAINSLACIGQPAVEPLIDALDRPEERVRKAAAIALVKMGGPAMPALEKMALFGTAEEQRTAQAIIASIRLTEKLQAENQTGAT
jgi:HEAT repeat protein